MDPTQEVLPARSLSLQPQGTEVKEDPIGAPAAAQYEDNQGSSSVYPHLQKVSTHLSQCHDGSTNASQSSQQRTQVTVGVG